MVEKSRLPRANAKEAPHMEGTAVEKSRIPKANAKGQGRRDWNPKDPGPTLNLLPF